MDSGGRKPVHSGESKGIQREMVELVDGTSSRPSLSRDCSRGVGFWLLGQGSILGKYDIFGL